MAEGKVSARTFANNDLTAIKTMFNRAVGARLLPFNPAKDLTVEEARKQLGPEIHDCYDDEAALILSATLAPPPARLSRHLGAARCWVP